MGGWRIIKTLGTKVTEVRPPQGFSSEEVAATVILASSHFGYPLSTTHVINGGIMGAGAAKRLSAVRWGVAGNIAIAWVLTLPAAALGGAAVWGVARIFGTGALGPVIVSVLLVGVILAIFARRFQQGSPVTATGSSR
jgi:inorganic phosphate transporter, PiT family